MRIRGVWGCEAGLQRRSGATNFLILAGIVFIVTGLILLLLGPKKAISWRLPGDIIWRRENFSIYFPIATCILISIILTLILRFIFRNR